MIVIYVLEGCPFCEKALKILSENKIKYEKIIVPNKDEVKNIYKKKMNMKSFPMIFIQLNNNVYSKIGGCSDFENYINKCHELTNTELKMDNIYALYKAINNK